MDYIELTQEDQWAIVQARRKQLEEGHFRSSLDAAEAEAAGKTDEQQQADRDVQNYAAALDAFDAAVAKTGVTEPAPALAEPAA